ncbi:uncharacterized protein [Dysidea avara]|uniref:uncharacterized protein n=1 Tax=Dysidea avara TaxID=196820 RepID=UPI003327E300
MKRFLAVLVGISASSLILSGLYLRKTSSGNNVGYHFHGIALLTFLGQGARQGEDSNDQYNIEATEEPSQSTLAVSNITPDTDPTQYLVNSVSTDSIVSSKTNHDYVTLKHLPQPIIDGVKKFVFFIGHCRSGHSIVGSLLDGHPHIVISHESKIFRRLAKMPSSIDKSYIFNTIWTSAYMSARESGIRTIRSRANGKGYTLAVGGLYQGDYESYIEVIGEKKAELTTELFLDSPTRLEGVINKLRTTVGLPMKVLHVIRNPFDNIATTVLYDNFKDSLIGKVKSHNRTYTFNSSTIDKEIDTYFRYYQAAEEAEEMFKLDLMVIHGKDFVADPRTTIVEMCKFLDVHCSDEYLEITSKKIFNSESKTRYKITWEDYHISRVQSYIDSYERLKRYRDFDS